MLQIAGWNFFQTLSRLQLVSIYVSQWLPFHQQRRYAFECSTHLDFQLKSFQWYIRSLKKMVSKCHCCWNSAFCFNDEWGGWCRCWCFLTPKSQKYIFIDSWNQASIIDMTSYFCFHSQRYDDGKASSPTSIQQTTRMKNRFAWVWSLTAGNFSKRLHFSISIMFNENIFPIFI